MAKRSYKFKTSTPKEVRQTLSTIVNLLANEKIDPKVANSITYVCNAINQSYRLDVQEKEIQELKDMIEEIKKEQESNE